MPKKKSSNKSPKEEPLKQEFTEFKVTKEELDKAGFTGKKFDYEIVEVKDLDNKVVNMGDYLLVLPKNCPPLIKIYGK